MIISLTITLLDLADIVELIKNQYTVTGISGFPCWSQGHM